MGPSEPDRSAPKLMRLLSWVLDTVLLVLRVHVPRAVAGIMPVVVIPLVSTLIVGFLMIAAIGQPIAAATRAMTDWLNGLNGSNAVLLGGLRGPGASAKPGDRPGHDEPRRHPERDPARQPRVREDGAPREDVAEHDDEREGEERRERERPDGHPVEAHPRQQRVGARQITRTQHLY